MNVRFCLRSFPDRLVEFRRIYHPRQTQTDLHAYKHDAIIINVCEANVLLQIMGDA